MSSPSTSSRRYILLGASNIALAFPRIAAALDAPGVEILAAFGHGRSFTVESQVLGRRLSSLESCGLWSALEGLPPQASRALITDVGNDLLYGVPVERLASAVEGCIQRLEALGARVVLTLPPARTVRALSRWRYTCLRTVLFPRNRDSLEDVCQRLETLRQELFLLARRFGVRALEPDEAWFGLDPIHIRPRAQGRAWRTIFEEWPAPEELPWPGWREAFQLWRLPPAERQLWGKDRTYLQPQRLRQGAELYLY